MSAASAAATGSQTLRQAKRALRKQMGASLAQLTTDNVTLQSGNVTQHILAHPAFRAAQNVSIYVSMQHSEVRTEELCRQALLQGKRLYVPRFAATAGANAAASSATFETDMRMLRVQDWDDFEAMVLNKWGIREPQEVYKDKARENALEAETGGQGLDLILVPGVAFDTFGGRLGHGKGYYDRYIARANAFIANDTRTRKLSTIALALKEQILSPPDRVPSDDNDLQMDVTMTADGPLVVQSG